MPSPRDAERAARFTRQRVYGLAAPRKPTPIYFSNMSCAHLLRTVNKARLDEKTRPLKEKCAEAVSARRAILSSSTKSQACHASANDDAVSCELRRHFYSGRSRGGFSRAGMMARWQLRSFTTYSSILPRACSLVSFLSAAISRPYYFLSRSCFIALERPHNTQAPANTSIDRSNSRDPVTPTCRAQA